MKIRAGRRSIEIPRPEKALFPDDGIDKGDLACYYRDVSEAMLPFVRDRPAQLHRYPDGLGGEHFTQKQVSGHFPDWLETVEVAKQNGSNTQAVISSAAALVYLAGQATITPHVWLSRTDRLDHPDQLVFDLDPPGGEEVKPVRAAVRRVREILDEVELPAFLKTSGSKGYHVVAPLDRRAGFDQVRELASGIARLASERDPDELTVEMRKQRRRGRVFVDWLRNAYGQTVAPPYAVRARPGAPVSMPIEWGELGEVKPRQFKIGDVMRRLDGKGDPWSGMRRRARGVGRARRRLDELIEEAGSR